MDQLDIFGEIYQPFKFTKTVRLIEFFACSGSQAMALRDLGVHFEYHRISEWETHAIASYKNIHMHDDLTDYSCGLSKKELADTLFEMGISSNGKTPMNKKSIMKKSEKWLRQTYNNIKSTNNLVDITKVRSSDLEIIDKAKYHYMLSYSFPCQNLSKAGNQNGMSKGSGTQSSLLWEVERIIGECWRDKCLPDVLLMENVPDVVGPKNIKDFMQWQAALEACGYQNYIKIINAKDHGIPQNRERCFMVSLLGDYSYQFPNGVPLNLRLIDMLEDEVDEKYYLSNNFAIHEIEND